MFQADQRKFVDPIPPNLFILCAEGLTRSINSKVSIDLWQDCKITYGAPLIDYLFLADDSLLVFW